MFNDDDNECGNFDYIGKIVMVMTMIITGVVVEMTLVRFRTYDAIILLLFLFVRKQGQSPKNSKWHEAWKYL